MSTPVKDANPGLRTPGPTLVTAGLALLATGLALLSAVAPATAQQRGAVEGRVVTTAGEPLPGAVVELEGTDRVARTDTAGRFRIDGLAPGTRAVDATAVGYRSARTTVDVGTTAARRVTLRLAPDPDAVTFRLDPLTVTATRRERRLSRVPASVSVVEGERLDRLLAQSVDDVIRDLPNVTTVGGPRRQAELPQIRGFGADRIVLRVDGARQSFSSGHKGRLFLDPALLQRVEVVRGPSSALHGSGGLGGVVAFETVDARDVLEPGAAFGYSLSPRFASDSDEWGGTGVAAGRAGTVDYLASASFRNFGDTRLSTGDELPFSAGESWSGLAKVGWEPADPHRVEVSWNRHSSESTTPLNASTADSLPGQVGDRSSSRETLRLGYRLRDADDPWVDLEVTASRNEAGVEERRLSDDRRERRNVVTWSLDASNTSRLALSDAVGTRLTVGAEVYRDDSEGVRDGDALSSFPDGEGVFTGVYLQNRWTFLDRVHLVPGLRWETYRQESDAAGDAPSSEDEVALKMAAELEVVEFLDVFGSWGEGFNAPRLLDLYTSGLHFPSTPGAPFPDNFFVSNPDLDPERSDTWETGARLAFDDVLGDGDGLRADLTYFETDAEDFIAREVDLMAGTTTFRNLDRVEAEGVEASVRYETDPFYGGVSHGRVRMRNLTAGEPVDDAPADRWVLDLGLRLADRQVVLGYTGTFAEAQEQVTDPSLATPGYGVSDLHAAWAPAEGPLSGFELRLRLDNVFDKAYRRHASFLPATGRSLRLQVTHAAGLRLR